MMSKSETRYTLLACDGVQVPGHRQTVTVEEAAEILGIGRTLAYEMARTNRLPVIRFGKRMVVSKLVLERMLAGE